MAFVPNMLSSLNKVNIIIIYGPRSRNITPFKFCTWTFIKQNKICGGFGKMLANNNFMSQGKITTACTCEMCFSLMCIHSHCKYYSFPIIFILLYFLLKFYFRFASRALLKDSFRI